MIVLDTHAWLWWLSDPAQLGAQAASTIEEARRDGAMAISAISVWETAMLRKKGRLELRVGVDQLVKHCQALSFLSFVAVDPAIAMTSVELDPLHNDPADRLIVATTLQLGATLITKDERLRASGLVPTIW